MLTRCQLFMSAFFCDFGILPNLAAAPPARPTRRMSAVRARQHPPSLRRRLNLAGVPRIDWIACEPGLEHLGVGHLERFTAVGELENVAVEDHEVRRLADLERPDLLLPAKKARPADRVSVQDLADRDRLPWIERRAVGVAARHGPRHVDEG